MAAATMSRARDFRRFSIRVAALLAAFPSAIENSVFLPCMHIAALVSRSSSRVYDSRTRDCIAAHLRPIPKLHFNITFMSDDTAIE